MSLSTEITVHCDTCTKTILTCRGAVANARKLARMAGWKSPPGGPDMCPSCQNVRAHAQQEEWARTGTQPNSIVAYYNQRFNEWYHTSCMDAAQAPDSRHVNAKAYAKLPKQTCHCCKTLITGNQ